MADKTKLSETTENVAEEMTNIKETMDDKAKEMTEDLAEAKAETLEAVDEAAEDVAESVEEAVEDTSESLEEVAEDASEIVSENVEEAAETVSENVEEAAETVSETVEEVTETVSENVEEAVKDKPKKKGRWKKVLGVAVLLTAAVYGGGCYYYSSHFPHAITANGQNLGELSVEDAEKVFTEDLDAHSITLEEKERKEVIDATKIGTKIDVGNRVQELFDSLNPYLWFTNTFGTKDSTLKLDVSFDDEALTTAIDSLECFKEENIVAPKSAYIEAGEKEFQIVPEVPGNTVLKDDLTAAIKESMATCVTSINLVDSNLYKNPKYYSTDEVVVKALETANKYTSGTISHDFTYATETIDYNRTKEWIDISKDFKVTLNASDVGDYVVELGKKYNTMGSSRPFKTAYGSKIRVYDGDYGWRIDFKKEKKQLIKDIKSGEVISRKPIYSYTAAVQTKETDIGDSYVEVSISAQELWLFVDGECILNSSVVTGKPGFDTIKGVYGITYKKLDDTLEGYNADGTPYASHVDYWMPFNGNQGLHDASWRDDFGGSIYKSNGSHGCVNCPVYVARTLYKYVDTGFPVIIY